jgi:hypothetical protein
LVKLREALIMAWSTKSSNLLILVLLDLKIAWRTIEVSAGEAAREDVAFVHYGGLLGTLLPNQNFKF